MTVKDKVITICCFSMLGVFCTGFSLVTIPELLRLTAPIKLLEIGIIMLIVGLLGMIVSAFVDEIIG